MGRYLNQGNESFEKSVNSEIYIDKTGLIKYTNRVLNTLQGYVCIRRPDEKIRKKVQENWDSLAKPLDGLGIFEKIFTQIGAVTGDERVPLQKKAVIVMCADNGIVEEGISQSGQEPPGVGQSTRAMPSQINCAPRVTTMAGMLRTWISAPIST